MLIRAVSRFDFRLLMFDFVISELVSFFDFRFSIMFLCRNNFGANSYFIGKNVFRLYNGRNCLKHQADTFRIFTSFILPTFLEQSFLFSFIINLSFLEFIFRKVQQIYFIFCAFNFFFMPSLNSTDQKIY